MRKQKANKKKIIVGVTGSIGSGKSTVAKMLRACGGAYVIDADKIAHQCLKVGSRAYKKIRRIFGTEVIGKKGAINRKKLAAIVFKNKKLLKVLNRSVHPDVTNMIKKQIKYADSKVVVLDVPLLIEAGLHKLVDKIIVVTVNREEQVKRLKIKSALSKAEILRRVKSQIPLTQKKRLADFVIDNSSTKENTKKQVAQIRRGLWRN